MNYQNENTRNKQPATGRVRRKLSMPKRPKMIFGVSIQKTVKK